MERKYVGAGAGLAVLLALGGSPLSAQARIPGRVIRDRVEDPRDRRRP